MPCSAFSAVRTWPIGTPSSTRVMAAAGWSPTMVASAPRRRIIATSRASTRATNESTMDSPLTSISAPSARVRDTSRVTARSICSTVESSRLPCNATSRLAPIRMMGTWSGMGVLPVAARDQLQRELECVPQAVAAAQVAQLDAEVDDRLRGLRAYPAQHARGTHQPGGLDRLQQVLGDVGVDRRYPADVEDDHFGLVLGDPLEESLGEPGRPQAVQRTDQRQHQDLVPHLDHRRGQLQDLVALPGHELLLLAAFGQVPGDLHVPHQRAFAVADRGYRDRGPEPAAVLADPAPLDLAPAGLARGVQLLFEAARGDVLLGVEDAHRAADDLAGGVPGQLFRTGVPAADQAVLVQPDDLVIGDAVDPLLVV